MTETAAASGSEGPRREQYHQTWGSPSGFRGWFAAVNNQTIGVRYLVTSFTFLLIGGVLALLMRIQLAVPENTFLGPERYNQLFTMHGSTMMYLFAVPFLEGLATLLVPLMIGSRDLAYPRLTAFGYWCYLFGGLIFYSGFVLNMIPDVGWFAYTPLSAPEFAGKGAEVWLIGLGLVEVAGIVAGAELGVTILKMRAPGMSLDRMPLFIWTILTVSMMMLFAFTTLLTASLLLELDHSLGTQFFDAGAGGSHLLWQHLFWFFGHPEVYIIFLPATGIVSTVIAAAAQRILGYTPITVAVLLTGFLSFGLWVHHMYTTGLPELSMYFFAAASLVIAAASGTQIFAWIASLWGRRPELHTPLLYVLGFVFIFVLGGMTGVMVAVVPFDWQVHDTYFIVAHFHYVLIGGAVFPFLAGIHYWTPKIAGRMLSERLGKWSFWLAFIGFNLTFFPMHLMGLWGLPRRVYTYATELDIGPSNLLATFGAFVLALGFAVFVVNVLWSLKFGPPAGRNPWGSDSLEWSLPSPLSIVTYGRIPVVRSRHPLWQQEGTTAQRAESVTDALVYRPEDWRAMLITDALTAEPQAISRLSGLSHLPLWTAVGLLIAGLGTLTKVYLLVPAGLLVSAGALLLWLWPSRREQDLVLRSTLPEETGLPVLPEGTRSLSWWGMVFALAVVGTIFLTLFYSYFYIRLYSVQWPQGELPRPELLGPALVYALLPAAAVIQKGAQRAFRRGNRRHFQIGLLATLLAACVWLVLQGLSLIRLEFSPQANAYASLFYVLSWALELVVLVGLVLPAKGLVHTWQTADQWQVLLGAYAQVTAMFWYFTATLGVLVFAVLYLSPYVV